MKVDMNLILKDVPGMLIRVLEPISKYGGNIISVIHSRGGKEFVGVRILLEVRDKLSLNRIKRALERERIRISDIFLEGKRYYSKRTISFILIGHVIDTDIQDTIDRINTVGMVSDIDVVMPSPEKKSSVIMNVDVDEKKSKKLVILLEEICKEKGFLLVRSLNENEKN